MKCGGDGLELVQPRARGGGGTIPLPIENSGWMKFLKESKGQARAHMDRGERERLST